ncbi:DHA2 family efflux MFS transporter permease subunit [Brevibacterium casei]|uniref:Drug resistance transporter, EmrB/QacA subfamily n=2 Tax=Brevibacterium casei TaxID=33889 RepID=A0A2H1IF47_9MICO|nr:DHA2 family efflux MFS transporter permease subunit [Brevibacterium casei]QPR40414.1 DHA2 family efflux MFS transporter permease subunit [Brevibacterium casei]QPR44569.1 DHA2 family efflux MFS transporter permease subunit [Brevibacterium casei]SMX73622.1 drug resistance transporter, EmrB/QacA subfamily [Brevibacterium casei CIP 102111]VEW12041.1 High-copy suppressor of rspA [Brevibacterium casei]
MPAINSDSVRIDRSLLALVGVLLVGASVALLDTTIVAVAIADLTRAFNSSVQAAQWATTAYLLAMAAAIPMMGWLTGRWGPRRVWLVTLWVFLIGSILCGLAWSIESLIAFRVVQGLGGGLILPLVQAMLARAAGPRRVGRVMGLIGIPGQLAPILGPVLGGMILGSLGWRWIFVVNAPLCLLALVLAYRHLHPVHERQPAGLDWIGALLMVAATVAVLVGLSLIDDLSAVAIVPLVGGVVLLAGFVLHAKRRGDRALLDLKLFRCRSFSIAIVMMFLSGVCLYGPMLLLPLFYQQARGLPVAEVGWMLAPQGLGFLAGLWVAGRYADRYGPRIVALAGTVLAGTGLGMFVFAGGASLTVLSAGLVALGAGLGSIGVAVSATSYRDVEPVSIPHATSLLNVVQRIGASFGTVVVALILHRRLAALVASGSSGIDTAFAHAFAWTLGFLGVALVIVLLLPKDPPPPPTDVRDPEMRTTT